MAYLIKVSLNKRMSQVTKTSLRPRRAPKTFEEEVIFPSLSTRKSIPMDMEDPPIIRYQLSDAVNKNASPDPQSRGQAARQIYQLRQQM